MFSDTWFFTMKVATMQLLGWLVASWSAKCGCLGFFGQFHNSKWFVEIFSSFWRCFLGEVPGFFPFLLICLNSYIYFIGKFRPKDFCWDFVRNVFFGRSMWSSWLLYGELRRSDCDVQWFGSSDMFSMHFTILLKWSLKDLLFEEITLTQPTILWCRQSTMTFYRTSFLIPIDVWVGGIWAIWWS